VGASCTNGVVTCGVSIFNAEYDWQGVVLQWRHLNICDEPWEPVDMDPLPLGPPYSHVTHTLTFPAHDPDEWVDYQAFYIDSAGALHPAPGGGWASRDAVSCADLILTRGYLVDEYNPPHVWFEACPDTCWYFGRWGEWLFTWELEPGTWEQYVDTGIPVNVWGEYHDDEMPGGAGIIATRIEAVPAGEGCGPPVASERATWGMVKSLYR
jgi:hypothetical protein